MKKTKAQRGQATGLISGSMPLTTSPTAFPRTDSGYRPGTHSFVSCQHFKIERVHIKSGVQICLKTQLLWHRWAPTLTHSSGNDPYGRWQVLGSPQSPPLPAILLTSSTAPWEELYIPDLAPEMTLIDYLALKEEDTAAPIAQCENGTQRGAGLFKAPHQPQGTARLLLIWNQLSLSALCRDC